MTTSKTFITNNPDETLCAGEAFGRRLFRGAVVALYGELGAGKTVFTKGIAKALGITDPVTSPTFCLVNVYNATTSAGKDKEKSATTRPGNGIEESFAQSAKKSDGDKKTNGGQGAMGAIDEQNASCGQGVVSTIDDKKTCCVQSVNSEGSDSSFSDSLDKGGNGDTVGQGGEGEKLGELTEGAPSSFEKLPKTLYHVDAYRLSGAGDFYDIGSDDFLYGEGVTVIEWPGVVEAALPKGTIKVHFSLGEGGVRTILCEGLDFS